MKGGPGAGREMCHPHQYRCPQKGCSGSAPSQHHWLGAGGGLRGRAGPNPPGSWGTGADLLFPTLSPHLRSFGEGAPCLWHMALLLPGHTSSRLPLRPEHVSRIASPAGKIQGGKKPNCREPAVSVRSSPPRRKQNRGHPTLLSPPVAVDLIKDLFNKRESEEREACLASPLSDEALCDSLNLFPASRTKPRRHQGLAVHRHGPQLSGFLRPIHGMQSLGAASTMPP